MSAFTIRNAVESAVSLIAWNKEQSATTAADRKAYTAECFTVMRNSPKPTDGDIANGGKLFADLLRQKGWKPDSIKVRKSEFLRIWENLHLVPEECDSWKAALAAIRDATVPRSEIIKAELLRIQEQIDRLNDTSMALLAELNELAGEADLLDFSDEVQAPAAKDGTNG